MSVEEFAKKVADTRKHDGGPAYPFLYEDDGAVLAHTGMTLRDWFAGQALVGLMLTPGCLGINRISVTESAYSMADEMLKARAK